MSNRSLVFASRPLLALLGTLASAPPVLSADYAAKVDKVIISNREVEQVLKGNPNLPDDARSRRAITEELVAHELIVQAAKKKKLDQDQEVKEAIATATRQILFTAGADRYLKEHPIGDSQLHEEYDAWAKNFPKEEYRVRHVLLKTQEEAERVSADAKEGKPFADLALQSLDTESARKGGEIGWITPMSAQTVEQLSKLKTGQVSEPLEAVNGWDVVEVLEKRPAHPPEFDQVKTRLQAAMQQEMLRRYVVELQQKSTVEIR